MVNRWVGPEPREGTVAHHAGEKDGPDGVVPHMTSTIPEKGQRSGQDKVRSRHSDSLA